jgi:hypothetical protein
MSAANPGIASTSATHSSTAVVGHQAERAAAGLLQLRHRAWLEDALELLHPVVHAVVEREPAGDAPLDARRERPSVVRAVGRSGGHRRETWRRASRPLASGCGEDVPIHRVDRPLPVGAAVAQHRPEPCPGRRRRASGRVEALPVDVHDARRLPGATRGSGRAVSDTVLCQGQTVPILRQSLHKPDGRRRLASPTGHLPTRHGRAGRLDREQCLTPTRPARRAVADSRSRAARRGRGRAVLTGTPVDRLRNR